MIGRSIVRNPIGSPEAIVGCNPDRGSAGNLRFLIHSEMREVLRLPVRSYAVCPGSGKRGSPYRFPACHFRNYFPVPGNGHARRNFPKIFFPPARTHQSRLSLILSSSFCPSLPRSTSARAVTWKNCYVRLAANGARVCIREVLRDRQEPADPIIVIPGDILLNCEASARRISRWTMSLASLQFS